MLTVVWLPLGAGEPLPVVRWSGRCYEALVASRERRPRRDLFHSALEAELDGHRYVVEMAPVWRAPARCRGVVGEGAVGLPVLGRSRWFRYEVRRWRDGVIPDRAEATSVVPVLTDVARTATLLDLVPGFPLATWGLDEQGTGDMWNSNSLVSWLLTASGHGLDAVGPPADGRAPGWRAGALVGSRSLQRS
jgi:hypothetical protein